MCPKLSLYAGLANVPSSQRPYNRFWNLLTYTHSQLYAQSRLYWAAVYGSSSAQTTTMLGVYALKKLLARKKPLNNIYWKQAFLGYFSRLLITVNSPDIFTMLFRLASRNTEVVQGWQKWYRRRALSTTKIPKCPQKDFVRHHRSTKAEVETKGGGPDPEHV